MVRVFCGLFVFIWRGVGRLFGWGCVGLTGGGRMGRCWAFVFVIILIVLRFKDAVVRFSFFLKLRIFIGLIKTFLLIF